MTPAGRPPGASLAAVPRSDALIAGVAAICIELVSLAPLAAMGWGSERPSRLRPELDVPVRVLPLEVKSLRRPKLGSPMSQSKTTHDYPARVSAHRRRATTPNEPVLSEAPTEAAPPMPSVTDPDPLPPQTPEADALPSDDIAGSDASVDSSPSAATSDGEPGAGSRWGSENDGEVDPLFERAVRLYRARLQTWLASRFSVQNSGLDPDLLTRLRADVTMVVDGSRRIESFRLTSSGNPIFDRAARRAAESVVGLELPPPPPHFPQNVQREIHVTYVCGAGACD